MKFFTLLAASGFLGLTVAAGTQVINPHFPEQNAEELLAREGYGALFARAADRRKHADEDPGLARLREKETVIRRRVVEAEKGLSRITDMERKLTRKIRDLKRARHRRGSHRDGYESIEASREALEAHLEALAEERVAFEDILDRLGGDLAACRIKIELWDVRTQRASLEDEAPPTPDPDPGPVEGLKGMSRNDRDDVSREDPSREDRGRQEKAWWIGEKHSARIF